MHKFFTLFLALGTLHAADWPMWRHDPGRTAATTQKMPKDVHLIWSRELPPLRPAFKEARLQFDRSYEPVVAGKTLIVGSSREDCIIAFDTDTGVEKWRTMADGPVRFAPVIAGDLVLFGADDGVMRCVKLADGSPVWSKKAVPSNRMLLGNQRLISVWPVRGGPVVKDGRVYFAAGVWPMEGTFVFCWDAATGAPIWCNDRCSYLYGTHPHATEAMGGLAPQGYLLIDGDDLVVPCSTAYPARLDMKTGAIKEFELPSAGRYTGGWFASTPAEQEALRLKRRGLLFDEAINVKRHEDRPRAEGEKDIQRTLHAADKEVPFDTFTNAHSVILADDKCFVVTIEGVLSAYGPGSGETKRWKREIVIEKADEDLAKKCIEAAGTTHGYALLPERVDVRPGFIESIITNSHFHLIVLSNDPAVRTRLAKTGLYGERVAILPPGSNLWSYYADVIFDYLPEWSRLRPMGGKLISLSYPGKVFHTAGPLTGSTNYLADWNANEGPLVQAPLHLRQLPGHRLDRLAGLRQ